MGRQGRLGRHLPCPGLGWRTAGAGAHRLLGREGASLHFRRQKGGANQAIGRSRGGRTTKIHALTDGQCRPIAFFLNGGQVADCTAADLLLEQIPKCPILHGDKGYDTNAPIRSRAEGQCRTSRRRLTGSGKTAFHPFLYRDRNAIERMFGRLKDFRRIATRYDRSATNFLATVCLAATVSYWL
ncbi:transposase [Mesorhizobium sp. URHB0026]